MSERYIWHEEDFPATEEISQIQAVLLTADGRVLTRIKNGEARLSGGRPEIEDTDIEETLRREVLEEANAEIDKIAYLGYQEAVSDWDDEEEIALQSRMVALVTETCRRSLIRIVMGRGRMGVNYCLGLRRLRYMKKVLARLVRF